MKVYLDNHSTTQTDPRVIEAMMPYFLEKYGNASSRSHSFGWEAGAAVEHSKDIISQFFGCSKNEVYFTSGATESINLAHFSAAQNLYSKGNHIITSEYEHSAVLDSLKLLERKGFEITVLPLTKEGIVDPSRLEKAFKSNTILVSIMTANNEIGTVNDVEEIGKLCRKRNVLFHTDATQAVGRLNLNINEISADLISFSSHKIYGPKGIGVLIAGKHVKLTPLLYGGGQQNGIRPGTLNIPGIVGTARAVDIFSSGMDLENSGIAALRDLLLTILRSRLGGVKVNGTLANRLPNNLNICIEGVRGDILISELGDIALSSGSACASETLKPSRTLKSIGLSDEEALSSLRIGIGRFNTEEEIRYSAGRIAETAEKIRLKQIKTTEA